MGRKDFFDPLRPRFSWAKHTETGWADGVFLLHTGRKDFFDTLEPAAKRPPTLLMI